MPRALKPSEAPEIRLDYDDYARLPNDGRRYEIIKGDIHMAPAPLSGHQWFLANLLEVLRAHAKRTRTGLVLPAPVDVILSAHDIVQPDIVLVRRERMSIVKARGIEGSPDLVVEILSPSNEDHDRRTKLRVYEHHAVPHYWIADLRRREVEEHVRQRGRLRLRRLWKEGDRMKPAAMTGLAIPLAPLWPPAELV